MEKITVTRGLRELKLLDARITKIISEITFVDCAQGRNPKVTVFTKKAKDDFELSAKEKMQSVNDLINRRSKIKSAIMKSNSETKIIIAGKEYFVIDAIEQKSFMKYHLMILNQMRQNYNTILNHIERNRAHLDEQIDQMVNNALGSERKIDKDTYEQIANPVLLANELKIVDPLQVEKEIEKLETFINEFEAEVDFILSESNSITEIEV